MKIYAIRDRLIDYWMQPFAAPDDKAVMQSISNTINLDKEGTNAIAQAPHHFELHKLGHVSDDGHLVPEREYICDCSALVRRDIRPGGDAGSTKTEIAPQARRGPLGGPETRTGADDRPLSPAAQAAALARGESH